MRTTLPLLALVPSILASQFPLLSKATGWLDIAKAYIPTSLPSIPIPSPLDAGASAVAAKNVERINIRNYARKLAPKEEGDEEWMLYVTGGNKTCGGRCGAMDLLWNESVPILSALPSTNLHLGSLDCEKEEILCTAWAASLPSIYHILIPSTSNSPTPLRIIPLNISTTTITHITSIPSSSTSRYADYEPYTGFLHPFDSILAKLQMLVPVGYLLWILGSTPSWLMMIGISFVSRQIMSRRMGSRPGFGSEAGSIPTVPGAGGAAAPVPGAAGPASPKSAGGKKRR